MYKQIITDKYSLADTLNKITKKDVYPCSRTVVDKCSRTVIDKIIPITTYCVSDVTRLVDSFLILYYIETCNCYECLELFGDKYEEKTE
jgi:hypothetical protein